MPEIVCPMTVRTSEEPSIGYDDLVLPFRAAEKPEAALRIGVEAEKFGILLPAYAPVPYEGARSISRVLSKFVARGFEEQREKTEGPVIALVRERSSITLEPGAQLELSGAPHLDLHAANLELEQHHAELTEISADLGIAWCSVGFHPLARRDALPWVPKLRYAIMREYLPTLGDGALEMMQRTATVQANLDYTSEADAMRKLRIMLRLSPLVHAMTSHSPLKEGRLVSSDSLRGDVWTRMDRSRSGLLERFWSDRNLCYGDYIEWALDAGMFLFKRHGEVIPNTGQSFRDFLRRGFQGHRATMSDWKLHLNTLFPEVRLKNTLEARSADAQPAQTLMSVPALWVGLMYDPSALDRAEALAHRFGLEAVRDARPSLIESGMRASIGGKTVAELGAELLEIAHHGLVRRGRTNAAHQDESIYLDPLMRLVHDGDSPADRLRRRLLALPTIGPGDIVEAIRIA
jgi:glutamate--cysteine ligase